MKNVLLVIVCILFLGVAGYFGFRSVVEHRDDVILSSADNAAVLVFEQATKEKIKRSGDLTYCFYLVEEAHFYEDYIEKNSGYLYSLDEEGRATEGETGRYVLCINQRYFYVEQDGRSIIYRELIGGYYPVMESAGTVIAPIVGRDAFAHSEVETFTWSETAGLNSFEDLLVFYRRMESTLYEVDEENQDIYVSMYSHGKWYPRGARIHATSEGVEITRIPVEMENVQ